MLFSFFFQLDLTSTSRPLLVTPNRFTRTIHGAYWNTGNGSPDAVAFSVDRPGILIAGVCVYGGSVVGGQYEYELELLDDVSHFFFFFFFFFMFFQFLSFTIVICI